MTMTPRGIRQWSAVALAALCVGTLTVPRPAWPAEPAVKITVTRNFYPVEEWEAGKQRRWMMNGGEIELLNPGSPVEVDLRFSAESFHRIRQLKVTADDAMIMIVVIPPAASRYVVVKHLRVPAGKTTLRFEAAPGPVRAGEVTASSDSRELSVAFGPFSIVDSTSPEGQIEQTGAFPETSWPSSIHTDEDRANDLRRQGRLAEARARYRAVIGTNSASQLSYLWAGLCALILGAPEEARDLFRNSRSGTADSSIRGPATQVATAMVEFVTRSQVIRRPDPVSRLRTGGEIYLAVPQYVDVLRTSPDDAVANFWLGAIYAAAERLTDARARFERIVQAYPSTYEGQFLRNAIRSSAP